MSESRGKNKSDKKNVGTRLSPDIGRKFNEYRNEHGVTKSEAARRLIRQGLEEENGEDGAFLEGVMPMVSGQLVLIAAVLVVVGHTTDAIAAGRSTLLGWAFIAVAGGIVALDMIFGDFDYRKLVKKVRRS